MIYEYKTLYKEADLYLFLKKNFIQDLKPTKSTTARHDCYSVIHNLDVELKCRRSHYDDLIIEKQKYDALMLRSELYENIPVYINSTPKGIWAFYIKNISFDWSIKSLPKQTDFGKKFHIKKEIGYLHISQGVNLITTLNERQ